MVQCRGFLLPPAHKRRPHTYGVRMFELLLAEYGVKITNNSFMEGYLNEHGEKIIESNALEVLRRFY